MVSSCMVSVIIATYRRDAELLRALHSLSNQSYRDFEIILVDDNNQKEWNEKVGKIVEDYLADNPDCRFNYIQNNHHLGSAETRNVGVNAARGTYVTFLDDDDEYMPEKIEKQFHFMEENKLMYSITDFALHYDNGALSNYRKRTYIEKSDKESLFRYHFLFHMTGTDSFMFRKDYFLKIGGFPPFDLGDEFFLMQKAIEGDGAFGYLNRCDIKAYIHSGETGLSCGQTKIECENRLYKYKKQYFSHFSARDVRLIKMRHYAVLSFTYFKTGKYFKFLGIGIYASLIAPVEAAKLLFSQRL